MKNHCFKISFVAIALFFIFTTTSHAQVDSVKAKVLKTQLLDTVCSCISSSDLTAIKNTGDLQTLLARCILGDISLFMDYMTATGSDMNNQAQMNEVGQKLGIEIVQTCPAMIKIVVNMAQEDTKPDSSKSTNGPPKK
jgi:hypothetical protein